MKRSVGYVWLGAAFLVGSTAQAQQKPVQATNPLFTSYDVLEFTIEAPFKKVFRERGQESEQFPAVLTYQDGGEPVSLNLKVNTRGRFRLRKRTCNFPPIQLDLQKDSVAGAIFAGQNKIKLVTHCQSGREEYEQYVFQEYLVYRAFSLFGDMSFRVRLAHITYVDNEEDKDPLTKYAFLIEHKDDLAARTGWEILGIPQVPPDYFDQDNLNVSAVFQFLIGNTDIAFFEAAPDETECCHNAKALGSMAGPVFSVPYDFDMAGIINTRYSEVSEKVPIRNVTQRFFRGRCVPPDQMARTLQVFQEQKEAMYALYMEQAQLDEKVREKTIEDLDDFYEIIDDDRKLDREIVRDCRRI